MIGLDTNVLVRYITQDDNAQYGLNIMEAQALKQSVANLLLNSTIRIYPGSTI